MHSLIILSLLIILIQLDLHNVGDFVVAVFVKIHSEIVVLVDQFLSFVRIIHAMIGTLASSFFTFLSGGDLVRATEGRKLVGAGGARPLSAVFVIRIHDCNFTWFRL